MSLKNLTADILYHLTRIKMPREFTGAIEERVLRCADLDIPIYQCDALVLGSGAAGLRAAVELKRRGSGVIVATSGIGMGTSACSGSDKQTLHTASTGAQGDNFVELAQAIGAGGAMDMDVAYVEAVGSIQAFAGLQYLGLPLPQDSYGAVLRYQTDHDEYGRATSCGPRTSRLMVKVLAEEARRLQVPILSRSLGIRICKQGTGSVERLGGLVLASNDRQFNHLGLSYVSCRNLVLATGGPGELYRDSVYPGKCHGSLGLALQAGIQLSNLTESQFGVSSGRDKFPWNLSGTYVQVMPHIYSVDAQGQEHHFLADYFPTTAGMCDSLFRKGYQWPFHAERTLNHESSLVDLAVYQQQQLGRTVYMDFLRNPVAVNDGDEFSVGNCDRDVRAYLENNQVTGELPIDRLRQMNPLAIELYRQNGTDLTTTPLAFGVNNQHMNGGIDVDLWGRTSLPGCYAIGEVASTHGVTRPGGAALNAGQVFAIRVADHAHNNPRQPPATEDGEVGDIIQAIVEDVGRALDSAGKSLILTEVKSQVQNTMSDAVGFICRPARVKQSARSLWALYCQLREKALMIDNSDQVSNYFLWQQNVLAAATIAAALDQYIDDGGGSRGARLICDPEGGLVPKAARLSLENYRFRQEQNRHRDRKQVVCLDAGELRFGWRELRGLPDISTLYFEKNWPDYLTGEIYQT